MNANQHLRWSSAARGRHEPRWWWPLARAFGALAALFVMNFAGATVIGLALLAPLERRAGRLGDAAVALLAVGGMAFLGAFLAARFSAHVRMPRW